MDYEHDYILRWKGKGNECSSRNVYETIRLTSSLDSLSKGVWSCKLSKMALITMEITLDKLYTFSKLCECESRSRLLYVLCQQADETPEHLFINCIYTCEIWKHFETLSAEATQRIQRGNAPRGNDLRIGTIIEEIQCFARRSPCLGIQWIRLTTFTWYIWME